MNTRPLLLFTLTLLAIVVAAASATLGKRGALVGGYTPIKNLHNSHLQEIAKYAITEHNRIAGTILVYVKILKGESQVVAGANYRLVISAKDGPVVHSYQAVIYERSWDHYRNLTSFNAV